MLPNHITAYGRVSNRRQANSEEEKSKQRRSIEKKFPGCTVDFLADEIGGHARLSSRPKFLLQLTKARDDCEPLVVDHSDRLLKTYKQSTILDFYTHTVRAGVEILYVIPNDFWHEKFGRILLSDVSRSVAIRRLTRRIAQYISWRHATQNGLVQNPAIPPLPRFSTLKKNPGELAVLVKGAERALSLLWIEDPALRNFCLDSYLGRAFDKLLEYRTAEGRKKSLHVGQRGYFERPEDEKQLSALLKQTQKKRTTTDGRQVPISNQQIADNLTKLGFRNLRNKPFSAKNVFDRLRSPEFQEYCNPGTIHPRLPDLES